MHKRLCWVEGIEDGVLSSTGTEAPWTVYDPEAKDWVCPDVRWRWMAALFAALYRRGWIGAHSWKGWTWPR